MSNITALFLTVMMLANSITTSASTSDNNEHKITKVAIEQQTSEMAYEDRTDVGTIEYDENGKITKADSIVYSQWEKYIDPKMVYTVITPGTDFYFYNKDGNVEKVERRNENDEILFTVNYEYDSNMNLVTETYIKNDKEVVSTYTYNDEGAIDTISRDDGNRVVLYTYLYHGDGTIKGLSQKYKIDDTSRADWIATIVENDDGNIFAISVTSEFMLDESTSFSFKYQPNGDLKEVTFNQGYFKVSYKISYLYEDVKVSK